MEALIATLIFFVLMAAGYAISWVITVALVRLIGACFGLTVTTKAATGIWLVMCMVKLFFSKPKDKED